MKKRVVSLLMALMLLMSLLPTGVMAAGGDWTYAPGAEEAPGTLTQGDIVLNVTANGTDLTITGYQNIGSGAIDLTGTITDAEGGSYTITTIGESAFESCAGLKSIVLPDGLTGINYNAFYNCTGLQSIHIPESVTFIGASAFRLCKSITSIVIPSGITTLNEDLFSGCDSLSLIVLPEGLKKIKSSAIGSCSGLRELTLPASVTTIAPSAFVYTRNLETLTLLSPTPVANLETVLECHDFSVETIRVPDGSVAAYRDALAGSSYAEKVQGIGSGAVLSVNPASLTFPDAELGYTPASRPVYITNSGSQAATVNEVKLTGANANSFQIIRGLSDTRVELGKTVNLTLAPVPGLTFGTYTANLEITIQGATNSITVPVSFKVNYPSDARTIKAGDVELIGASTMLAYATTNASTGNVTAQPTYTDSDPWNIKWDGSTLTLRNANIQGSSYYGILYEGDQYEADESLTILLEGANTVSAGNGYNQYDYGVAKDCNGGIFMKYGSDDLTIRETEEGGSLTVSGGNIEFKYNMAVSAGIIQYSGQSIIESGTVNAVGGTISSTGGSATKISCGIYNISNDVEVKGGKLIATGRNSDTDHVLGIGLYNTNAGSTLTISGGEVTVQGDAYACTLPIKFMPGDGKMIVATAGSDAASATQIEGSPFVAYTDVDRIEGKYAHFTTMDNATLTFKGSYSIPEGTVGTTYTMETPLQAMGGDGEYTFSVSEQPKAGTLTINGGCLVYTYSDEPTEATTATIKVTDGSGNVATATVLIGAALAKTYTLTVENGTGGGTYKAGDEVTIRANDESKSGNMLFDYWTTDPEEDITCITDVNAQETTLTMPAHDLTVTPKYIESASIWLSPGYEYEDSKLSITIITAVGRDFTLPGKPEEYTHPQGKTFLGWESVDIDKGFHAVGSTVHIPEDAVGSVYRFNAIWGENAAVTVGGKVLEGPAYATTDADGNVTVQPTYTEDDAWNIKWDGSSTLTLKNAVIKSESGAAVSGDSLSVITLTGSNKVTATGGSGIYSSSTALMINGEGSLTVNAALTNSDSAGIYAAKNLTVADTVSALSVSTTGGQGAVIKAESIIFEGSSTELELGRTQGQTFLSGATSAQKALPAEEGDDPIIVIRDINGNERVRPIDSSLVSAGSGTRRLILTAISEDDDSCIHIYPTRPANTVLVTIQDVAGGTGESMTYLLQAGSEFVMPECSYSAPEGKVFDCWVDVNDSEITYDAGEKVSLTADTIFKAQWKAKPPVITVKTDPADVGAYFGVIELEELTEDWSQMTPEPLVGNQYQMQDAENTVILVCSFGSEWVLDSVDYVEALNVVAVVNTANTVLISTDSDVEVTLNFREAQGLVVGNEILSYDNVPVYATTNDAGVVTVQPDYKETDDWNIKWNGSTLTLRGANIKGVQQDDGNAYGIYSEKDLAVVLEGSNTVTGGAAGNYTNSVSAGIYSIGSIEFSGSGSLTAQGANGCTSVGIMSHSALKFTGPIQVTATGADIDIDPDSLGQGSGASSILGSYWSAGVVGLGSVSIESGAEVNATGGNYTLEDGDPMSLGCYSNILKVDDGKLIAKSGNDENSSGIICMSTIEVSNGELQAHGQRTGIDEGSRMELREGSKVIASAEDSVGGAVSLIYGVYVYPTAGHAVQILAGTSEQNAQEIDGSPFTDEGKVSLPDGVTWFQSEWIKYEQHEHNLELKSDETGHWRECTSCDYTTAVEAHTPGEWTVLTPATEDSTGLKCRDCIVCGYRIETRVIPATGSTTETSVKDIDITTGKSVVSNTNVPAGTEDIIAALESYPVEGTGLVNAAQVVAADSKAMEAAAELAQTELGTEEPVTIIIETYLEVEVIKAEQTGANTRSFTLDITAMYQLKATDDQTTVTVGEPQELTVTSPVTLTIPMPADFGLEQDEINISHETGGSSYVYEGSVSDEKLTFTAQHGLGRFTITAEGPVASIGSVNYTSLQAAVDAVGDKETIKVYVDGLEAVVSGNKTFYIELSGATQYPDLSAASGYVLTDDGNGTYTVSKQDQGSTVDPRYIIYVERSDNGSVSVWPGTAAAGTVVTVNVKPDEGYVLDELAVTDSIGRELDVQYKGSGKYTFKMPASWVKIEASFRTRRMPFADVAENAWYTDAVRYVYEHDLMDGIGSTTFAPDATTSRAMIATILWRMAGSPAVNGSIGFSDVADGQWYSEAIRWAASEGIVDGYGNGSFGPNDPITREQFAAMLWRYAASAGYDVSIGESTNILSYADATNVSEYAIPAMQWACGSGVITGISEATLVPLGEATRAQAATMLMRFCEKYVKW